MKFKFFFPKRLIFLLITFVLIYIFIVLSIYKGCENIAVSEAEKSLQSFLLSQKAIRSFVQEVQKEEIYRIKDAGHLYKDYFSSRLLSSTYIVRNINQRLNSERQNEGLTELYFKFASDNPRNPENQADQAELKLLHDFRDNQYQEYQDVVEIPAGKSLYYAIPVNRSQESCIKCHGHPDSAPQELLGSYGRQAGFYEDVGDIRALMSVRLPLNELIGGAHQTALILSAVTFFLLGGVFLLIYGIFKKIDTQEQIQARLQKAEKMESIGLLAGGVAHDLNNILTGIINYPELMLRKLPPESELKRPLLAIQKSGERAAAVVADLLTVARGVATKKEFHDLNQLVIEQLHSPEFSDLKSRYPHVDFSVALSKGRLNICCSAVHIKKSLGNLLLNAFEAIETSGHCQLSTGKSSLDQNQARSFNVEPGEYHFVRIMDTGPGIPDTDLSHVFEPFYSTKKMGKSGTGLGLSVVWNTVKEHQGAVTVESDRNGTRFELLFPASKDADSVSSAEVSAVVELMGNQESILVVDDEEHMRDIASQILSDFNYQVISVASGEKAVDYLKEQPFDLILLDMLMDPGINGRQTYEAIRRFRPEQITVISSGFSSGEDVKKSLQQGAKGFIKKPYTSEDLGRVVMEALTDNNTRL